MNLVFGAVGFDFEEYVKMKWDPALNVTCDCGNVLPAGQYDAVVTAAVEKTSHAGNLMIHMRLLVDGGELEDIVVDSFLLPLQQCLWKVKSFCEATGLMQSFDRGFITPEDCRGIAVRVELSNDDPDWDGSVVKDFISRQ